MSPSPFVPFSPVSVPLAPRRVRICKCPCLCIMNELVRCVWRDVIYFAFPFPYFFVSGLPPAGDSEFPVGLRALCGAPARSTVETVVPFPSVFVPPAVAFVPFPPLRTSPPAFHARPPPFDYRLPIRIAPLLFWILFVRLVPSNSSPPLLDSGRTFSPRRMAPLRGTLDVLRRWMRPISKLLPDSGRSLDRQTRSEAARKKLVSRLPKTT